MNSISRLIFVFFLFIQVYSFGQTDSIYHDGMYRSYLLHLPSDYNSNDSIPLVIAMHGGFGSGPQLENQSQLSVKADEENFIVVYPNGIISPLGISTWNGGECCGYAANTNVDDVGFISSLLDSLFQWYSIDTSRVYATGMSNGAYMTYRLACELPNRIAAIAPVAGSMGYFECAESAQIPIIHFHSYMDINVPFEGGIGDGVSNHYNTPLDSVFSVWSEKNNCLNMADTIQNDIEYTHVIWDDCDCNYLIEYYITQDGGHSWPGGEETITGDPTSVFINANDLMWDFFEQYTTNCNNSLKIEETPIEEQYVKIYPNPTTGNIVLVGEKLSHVIVYNNAGQMIMDMDFPTSEMLNINLSGNPKGNYYVRIHFMEDQQEVIKVSLQ